jgi:hypothetical protein
MGGFYSAVRCGLLLSVCVIAPCSASVITASTGNTVATAQDLTALTPTEIIGALSGDPNDVAIFLIPIRRPDLFSVMTLDPGAFSIQDTVLSLFDLSGVGIYLNDDISGADTFSCISTIAGVTNPCPLNGPLLPVGDYYLALSRSANYPVDGSNNEIFNPLSSTDLATLVSGAGPLSGWDGNSFTSPDSDLVNYDIVLTGTVTEAVPEPGTWLMSGIALVGLLYWARRRRHPATY